MQRQLDDLRSLASYLADVRSALDSFRDRSEDDQHRADVLGVPLAEIERFVVSVAGRVERFLDAQTAALRSSRHRYQDLVDHLPVAMYVNSGGTISLANAACAALFGAGSPAQLVGHSPLTFYDPADHAVIRERMAQLAGQDTALPSIPLRVVRLDGRRIDVEVAASSFSDDGKRATHVVLRDVTDQRAFARRIGHLNAILDGLRRVNRLITRERSPAALLRRSVEILVETRGFASAMILLREGEGLRVGAAVGKQDRVALIAGLVSRGAPPPCVARAAAGETVVVHDPGTSCAGCPSAIATSAGHAVICLPLRSEGRDFGVLHAVLPPGIAGDGDETALITELASDVAFALRSMELEAEIARAQEAHALTARALTESEERFRGDFEHAAGGRSISTPDGRIIRVNRSLAAMLGTTSEALVGRDVEELVHPDDRGWSRDSGLRLLSGEATSFQSEIRFLRSDGSTLWVNLSTSLHRDASGAPVHFTADVHDVSAQKRAQAESVLSWSRLETLAQVVSMLSGARSVEEVAAISQSAARALVEADGATLAVRDDEECRYVGEDAVGPLWKGRRFPLVACACGWAMLHGEQVAIEDVRVDDRVPQEAFRPTFVRSLVTTPIGGETVAAALGVYWGSVHAPSPEELGILRALADATSVALENIAAYERLRVSEERYRNLIESLDDVVYRVDAQGRISYASGAASRFGFRPSDLLGRPFREFVHPDDRERLEQTFVSGLAEDLPAVEFRVLGGDGRVRIVRTSARRVLEGGRLAGLAGVLVDLTAQRSTEEQLRAAQKMEAVGRLAGGVAHDFNNLLTVITSYAGLATRGLSPEDPRRADLAEVRKAGERASALTRQLLAFSRRQVLQPTVIDVTALIAGMERMLARLIGEDVELRCSARPGVGRIRADPGQVEQVLMNLAVNARDAMPGGGRLVIEVEDVDLDDAFVASHLEARAGPFVRFRVTDTGCGMDAATRERLFEPFFTTKPEGKGTGLGLATVYGIVRQSGGFVWVDSEPGRGATFDVCFPRVNEPLTASPSPLPAQARAAEGTILFVEDDEAIRSLAARVLVGEGYEVLLAANGGEALVLAERRGREIDLVVTDVVMPGMSGPELAARLAPLAREAPILFVSGYSHDAIGGQGVLEPGTLFLAKPFTPESLLARVREVMKQLV